MQIRASIRTKMLVSILTTVVIIFTISIIVSKKQYNKAATEESKRLALNVAKANTSEIEKKIQLAVSNITTLASAFSKKDAIPENQWKNIYLSMYQKVYSDNPIIHKLWDTWEYYEYDTINNKTYERYGIRLYNKNNLVRQDIFHNNTNDENTIYSESREALKPLIHTPVNIKNNELIKQVATISAPIIINNEFAGIIAAEILIEDIQKIVKEIRPFPNTHAILTANNGSIIYHKDSSLIGKDITIAFPDLSEEFTLSDKIKNGTEGIYSGKYQKKDITLTITPINANFSSQPWSLCLVIPTKHLTSVTNKTTIYTIITNIIGLLLVTIVIIFIAKYIKNNLNKASETLVLLATGNIDNAKEIIIKTGDAIENIADSVNKLIKGLNTTSEFAKQIGEGNLNVEYKPLSDKDSLGNSLLYMRENLKKANKEAEERKLLESKQNWATSGLAKFSDILHANNDNIHKLSYQIMSNLINYLDANQGALFIIEEDYNKNKILSLKSAIAYGREKHMKREIEIGEDLVGRCAYETKTIYITDVPNDYINITSGLGTANPGFLLLVPLSLNNEIFGVIEIASFNNLEKHQIEFVEKLGESIASTISNVKINERTSSLLKQSKQQTEEMAAQEEEMRQNLEELQATQEEASRREHELEAMLKTLGDSAFIVEYDMDGKIIYANEKYAGVLGIEHDKIIGMNHADGFDFNKTQTAGYEYFWNDLKKGISKKERNKLIIKNKEIWIEESYTPIFGKETDKPYKILKIGIDITAEIKYNELLTKLKTMEEAITYDNNKDNVILIDKGKINNDLISEKKTDFNTTNEHITTHNKKTQDNNELDSKNVDSELDYSKEDESSHDIITEDGKLICWHDKYEITNNELNEQHKQLIELANILYSSVANEKSKKEIKDNLRNLTDFAAYHFGNEESYLEEAGYNNMTIQLDSHKQFMTLLENISKALKNKTITDYSNIMNDMKVWLHLHFSDIDKLYDGIV